MKVLLAQDILLGYRTGIFPMAKTKTSKELYWVKPKKRGVIPIGRLHISKSLRKFIRSEDLHMSLNRSFLNVLNHCANREDTWINDELHKIYLELYQLGHAISIEVWSNNKLIGGLFGVKIGSCFCGESMFSISKNGSKLAMIVTMGLLRYNNFTLFDTQFMTEHLKTMGGSEITQTDYEKKLTVATTHNRNFSNFPSNYSWPEIMQLNNHKL